MMRKRRTVIIGGLCLLAFAGFGQEPGKKDRPSPLRTLAGHYSLALKDQVLEVDPSIGGRIVSLKWADMEFLTGKEVNDFNWGSTVWPSPQRDWNWPPPAEWDNKPYQVALKGDTLDMQSQADPKTGLVLTKRYYADVDEQAFVLIYQIRNTANVPRHVAPWEVTRVYPDGISFFPLGDGKPWGGLLPLVTVKKGISWFPYMAERLPVEGNRQLYADGAEGWLAHIKGRILLAKKFEDIPLAKNAPEEGEVEWFVSPVAAGKSYEEIEHQGPYEELKPGETLHWEVRWFLRKVPDAISPGVGSDALVEYVRQVVHANLNKKGK